ncbi:MAG: hypothetical protein ACE5K8_05080, partial [Candidatus Zixiibacteriota bacterium]
LAAMFTELMRLPLKENCPSVLVQFAWHNTPIEVKKNAASDVTAFRDSVQALNASSYGLSNTCSFHPLYVYTAYHPWSWQRNEPSSL